MLNTTQSAKFLGVNRANFCTFIVPVISHLSVSSLHKQERLFKNEDLLRIKPFLEERGCGRIAARAIKKFLEDEVK